MKSCRFASWSFSFLAVLLSLAVPTARAEWNSGTDTPPAATGSGRVNRGYIIPYVEPAKGGAKLTVDIYHNSMNDAVSLSLQAVVNDGKGKLSTIILKQLDQDVADNPKGYRSRREFHLDYSALNRKLRELAPEAPKLRVEAGSALFVGASFHTGHQWGGPMRAGVFYLPPPEGSRAVKEKPESALPQGRSEALDIAQPIRQALANVYNLEKGRRGLKVGGQIRSRVEGEGKFQLTGEQFSAARKALYEMAQDPAKARAMLGREWSLTMIDRYLQKTSSGSIKKDKNGFPIPDPMVDTYYDNAEMDAAKNDMAIRYRWTEGNRAGAWNFKPGMGVASKDGVVYRVEYGIDTTDNQPESLAKFADSNHPLNPFRLIRQVVKGAKPSEFLLPAVKITDYRHKFLLRHQNGLQIEVSLDDVHPESLRGKKKSTGHFYQLEMDIDHLAVKSNNNAQGGYSAGLGSGATGMEGEALKKLMAGLSDEAFLDGRPTLHVVEDILPESPVRTKREADFLLASSVISKLRDGVIGSQWVPGAQKYAISAYVAGLIPTKDASSSVEEVLKALKRYKVDPELAGCLPGLAGLGRK